MKPERTLAIVLRRTNYGESDRIIHLVTPLGQRSAIAKGVRKQRSKLAGGIELLSESEIVLRKGKGSLMILGSARTDVFYNNILQDYDRLTFAYEVLKLVARAIDTIDEPEWFDITSEVLAGLNDTSAPLALVKAWFYLHHSKMLGGELSVWRDIKGDKILEDQKYHYAVADKGFELATNGEIEASHIKLLRVLNEKPLSIARKVSGIQQYLAVCAAVAHQHVSID